MWEVTISSQSGTGLESPAKPQKRSGKNGRNHVRHGGVRGAAGQFLISTDNGLIGCAGGHFYVLGGDVSQCTGWQMPLHLRSISDVSESGRARDAQSVALHGG